MPKPKPDHREQVEFKFGPKERRLLDDLQLNQSFKTGGGLISDLGNATSSIISAFTTGGDAGLLLALGAAYVADNRLDLKSDNDLQEWLNNFQLYSSHNYGIYPSVIQNENGGYGGPVCFVDPKDLGEDHYSYDADRYGQWIHGRGNEAYERIVDVYHQQIEEGTRTAPKPLPFEDKSWPWWIYHTALTYEDPCPQILDVDYGHLAFKYNFHLVQGGGGKLNDIVFVWNNQFENYKEYWNQLNPEIKMAMYIQGGGKTRTEIDSLMDILGSIDNMIPGAGAIQELAGEGKALFKDVAVWGSKKVRKYGRWFANPIETVRETVTNAADVATGAPTTTYYVPEAGYVEWPSWAMPPNNLYKFQTIHNMVEVVKVCVPWYLGTKFAIEAAKAAGEIIPG